jgi:ATP-dependent DNA ligase
VNPPILPMLSKRVDAIPEVGEYIFEPKWDGFRTIVFRDGAEILLQSRDEKPLNRFFPEIVPPLLTHLPQRCVLDGEIVIARNGALDFDALQLRLHPAASRVRMLAAHTPSAMVFFDLLSEGDQDFRLTPFVQRRKRLEFVLRAVRPPLHLTPSTQDHKQALDWFRRFEGAGFDGVMAKPVGLPYESGKRTMLKVKHERDCDCVVGGFRWHKKGEGIQVGSLLLGLYGDSGLLQHVGVCASFREEQRRELAGFLAPFRKGAAKDHPWNNDAGPGGQSRWSRGKDLTWEPLRPELVAEVTYEHMQGPRFRHMAHFRRWREDKLPSECTFEQVEVAPPRELMTIFAR